MKAPGYQQFVAQGGDLGAVISHALARQAPPDIVGITSISRYIKAGMRRRCCGRHAAINLAAMKDEPTSR